MRGSREDIVVVLAGRVRIRDQLATTLNAGSAYLPWNFLPPDIGGSARSSALNLPISAFQLLLRIAPVVTDANVGELLAKAKSADDGAAGELHLLDFQDNDKTFPTILTTSQKLSTGVDARSVRNIVLMRLIRSMIEFKQIIGRGTRTYDGKDFSRSGTL